jgi:hypothetical protein
MSTNKPRNNPNNNQMMVTRSTQFAKTQVPNAMDTLMREADRALIEYPEEQRGFAIDRLAGLVRWGFNVVIALIFIRFVLLLIAAPPDQSFAATIYVLTESLIAPFSGLVENVAFDPESLEATRMRPNQVQHVAEFTSILAMIVYAIVRGLATQFVRILFGKPRSSPNQPF